MNQLSSIKKTRLGDLLKENNLLSEANLNKALLMQNETGQKLGNILIEQGFIEEAKLLDFLAKQLNLKVVNIKDYRHNVDIIRKIPETMARRYRAVPIDINQKGYIVAMVDPTDLVAMEGVLKLLEKPIEIVVVREIDLLSMIDEVFRKTVEIANLVNELEDELGDVNVIQDGNEELSDAPILKLLYSIFEDAVQVKASDVHIEPDKGCFRIRQRVDGVLQEQVMQGSSILQSLILRLKLMAKLNISERRLPQDGRFSIKINGKPIDVRLSTLPLSGGESCVMRLLDQSNALIPLSDLGMSPRVIDCFHKHLLRPLGMILVTGPTGSGKSTTLYAGLAELNSAEKKIITVEDPVEYTFERINQIQVQPSIDLGFSKVLRSALRHDPDVIMVGEIRDYETAEIALRAAMTGHLVLSSLHTNDAISAPGRLLEMGMAPFLVASALHLVIAQRLIRRVCSYCATSYRPSKEEEEWITYLMKANTQGMQFVIGSGCGHCNMTGYRGRIGIYEVLEIDSNMSKALKDQDMNAFRQAAIQSPLYRTLSNWALDYACRGITTIEEVIRLSNEVELD